MGKIIHIVAWGILIGSPFFFTGREPEVMNIPNYVRSLIVPISFMFIFYVNYFLLIDRYLFQKHTWKFFLSNLFLIMLAIYSIHFIMELLPPPIDWEVHPRPRPQQEFFGSFRFFLVNAMLYLLVSGLSVAIKMTGSWYQMETTRRELEKSR
ncbi:MAG: sensor histidine kinase, partial [Parabacteroides sp.]|nr:sensor histidine kinase [Parabacteroides sp.]